MHDLKRVRGMLAMVTILALGAACAANTTTSTPSAATDGTITRTDEGGNQNDGAPTHGGKLVYGLRTESNGWNPGTNNWAPSGLTVAHAIFDTLAAFDDQGQYHPYLAAGFDHNADFTEWTIRLRPGVTLHNGKPVDSEVVRRDQQYLKSSPITGTAYIYVESITTDGPDKVVTKLTQPWVNFPASLATQIGVVSDPDWLESNDGKSPIGTGPFVLDSWEIGNKLTVKRNATYWQSDAHGDHYPYLDNIEFRVMTDGTSRANALRAGDIDVAELVEAPPILDFTRSRGDFQVLAAIKGESLETFIMLNNAAPPFNDPDARRALAYATDQKAYNEADNENFLQSADGPFAPGSPYYAPTGYPSFDLAKAQALVSQYKVNHGGAFAVTLTVPAETQAAATAQILQQQWSAAGVDVKIESIEQAPMIIQVIQGHYQGVLWQQFDAPDPALDFVWWDPANAKPVPEFTLNFARYNDPAVGELLKHARSTPDQQLAAKDYQAVARQMGVDVPYVWLNHAQFVHVAGPTVVNLLHWKLPDNAVGLPLNQQAPMLHQVWLQR